MVLGESDDEACAQGLSILGVRLDDETGNEV